MKTIEIVNLHDALQNYLPSAQDLPTKFAYKAARNLEICKPVATAFRSAIDLDKNSYFVNYNKKRVEIVEAVCKKDETGKPISDASGNYTFNSEKDQAEVVAQLNQLFPEHNQELNKHNEMIQNLANLEENLPLLKATSADLPPTILGNVIMALLPMIED